MSKVRLYDLNLRKILRTLIYPIFWETFFDPYVAHDPKSDLCSKGSNKSPPYSSHVLVPKWTHSIGHVLKRRDTDVRPCNVLTFVNHFEICLKENFEWLKTYFGHSIRKIPFSQNTFCYFEKNILIKSFRRFYLIYNFMVTILYTVLSGALLKCL
jgi:hypothetical protein